jgi:hypothetical protein
MWNDVYQFKDWWVENRPIFPPFKNGTFITDLAYSLCLFRSGQFQVELYIIKPNSTSPEHAHPGVDSVFMYLGGNIEFGKEDGSYNDLSLDQVEQENGTHKLFGRTAEAMDGAMHSVRTFDQCGAFLSFEHWKTKEPDSVVLNWKGKPDGEKHQKLWDEK